MADITSFPAYGVNESTTTMSEMMLKTVPLSENDVAIDVTHCGICHSDIHHLLDDWASLGIKEHYPMCPGHEVVGRVVAIGSSVSSLRVGDRVGCGPQRDSACLRDQLDPMCENCAAGEEQLCEVECEWLYGPHTGGFGSHLRVPAHMAFKIPHAISSAHAAPLMCAGVTVYAPLVTAALPARARVAVVGIGGLGHLAVMYAAAMGYEVTAITRSMDKAEMVKSYGATRIIDSTDPEQMAQHKQYFHFILNTVSAPIPTDRYLAMLKKKGTMNYVGLGSDSITFSPFSVVGGNKTVRGSFMGGSKDMVAMLNFSAEHKIFPTIEVVAAPFEQDSARKVTAAVGRVVENTARFRVVLDYQKEEGYKTKL